MKTNFNRRAWRQHLAIALGCMAAIGSFALPATAQNFGQPQFNQPQNGDPSQFGGQGQFAPQGQFNRPQQQGQFGQGPSSRQGQFAPQQQMNPQSQFRPQQGQFGSQNSMRGQNNAMQARGSMPRTVGRSQRSQSGQFNRPQGMPGGNQMAGNPNMNSNSFAQNPNMQGMNRGQNANPGFMGGNGQSGNFGPQANMQASRGMMNPNQGQFQGQQFQGQQFQAPQGQQFQGPQGPQGQGQFQGQQFQGQQFQAPQNQGQFGAPQFQGPQNQNQGQFGQGFTQNAGNSQACQFCGEGTCPAGACANGQCQNCPNGNCALNQKPSFGQPQGNVQLGAGFSGVLAPEADDAADAPIDLVLQNVEMVFAGDLASQQGPVYRVSVLNKSAVAVEDGFEVGLMATNGGDPDAQTPANGQRIETIGPGQVAVVDVQLPPAVLQMGKSSSGEPQAFSALIVVVDARQEIGEADKSNNATKLPRGKIRTATANLANQMTRNF